MSYTVLARRYRSSTFDEVVGQEHVARTLKRAIESGRVAHAFLFCGTRGVGKTSMARILAKALNCDKADAPTPTPCGQCTSCTAIARGDDMDVIEIDAASNTSVDQIREIIENSRFRPARARLKVYIIDEVHMLSRGAFNALLKTLEEPPSHVKFILATTETEKVPATILSRCQRYDFRNIPTREIAGHLREVCKRENVKAEDDALFLLARAGAGSMRDALSLLERVLSLGEKRIDAESIEQMLGLPRTQALFELAGHIGAGDVKATLELADRVIAQGLSPDTLVASLADHFRTLLLIATCGKDSELVEVAGVSLDELAGQAGKFDAVGLSQSIAILEDLRRGLRNTTAGRAMFDATLVRLALAEQFTRIEALLTGAEPAGGLATPVGAAPAAQKKKLDMTDTAARRAVVEALAAPAPRVDEASSPVEPEAPRPVEEDEAPVTPGAPDGDAADALPAVGKVFDGPSRSLGAIFASSRRPSAPRSAPSAAPETENVATVADDQFAPVMVQLRDALRRHGPGYDGLLMGGRIVMLGSGKATIRFGSSHEASARMLERNGKRETVQAALSEVLNEAVGLRIEVAAPEAEGAPPAEAAAAQAGSAVRPARRDVDAAPPPPPPTPVPVLTAEQKQAILDSDPLVRAVCGLFAGEIVRAD